MFGEVRASGVFPAILKFFEDTAAAFGETGVADIAFRSKHLSAGSGYRLPDYVGRGAGNSLIALAVIVCTYIEMGMVFAVVLAD